LDESYSGLIEVQSWIFPNGTEENYGKLSLVRGPAKIGNDPPSNNCLDYYRCAKSLCDTTLTEIPFFLYVLSRVDPLLGKDLEANSGTRAVAR
jgi:hypothetical protein